MVNNIYDFPDQQLISKEAAQWLVLLDRDVSPRDSELSELKEWMSRSETHRKTLIEMNQFLSDTSLTNLMVHIEQTNTMSPRQKSSFKFDGIWSWLFGKNNVTAAFAGIFSIALLFVLTINNFNEQTSEIAMTNGLYISPLGKQKEYKLADGSVITLNTNTKITVDFNDNTRNIFLESGEAHFKVAHNKEVPFRVYGAQGRVEAVGTAFTVKIKENSVIDVLVTEGIVSLASAGTELLFDKLNMSNIESSLFELGLLTAGERVKVDTLDNIDVSKNLVDLATKIKSEEMVKLQAWRDGLLIFEGESLKQVITEVSRFTDYKIKIIDEELNSIAVAGRFKIDDINSVLLALESSFPIEVTRVGYKEIELKSKTK